MIDPWRLLKVSFDSNSTNLGLFLVSVYFEESIRNFTLNFGPLSPANFIRAAN